MRVWRGTYREYQRFKAMPDGVTTGSADLIEIERLPALPPSIRPCLGWVSFTEDFRDLTGAVVVESEEDELVLVDAGDEPCAFYEGAGKGGWWDPGEGTVFVLEEWDLVVSERRA